MITILARGRALFASLVLAFLSPCAIAAAETSRTSSTDHAPAGDPNLGMLIILGGIGFFIILAWIFSRMGDDGNRGPDRTLL